MGETMNEHLCGCGCGTVISPRSYAHKIGENFYAQKCVRLVVVPDPEPPTPATTA